MTLGKKMITPARTVKNVQLWEKRCRQLNAYAGRLAAGEIDIFEGSIRMLVFQAWLCAHDDPDFEVFRKVSDSSIGLPIGKERVHWNSEALASKDEAIERLRRKYTKAVLLAASKVGEKYSCAKKSPTRR